MIKKKFPRGILLIAYNNNQIDYAKLALLAAKQAKMFMNNIHITLMTDESTLGKLLDNNKAEHVKVFDHIIVEKIEHEANTRVHHDSPWYEFSTQFSNKNKHTIYDNTPYEQTLMIDVDFMICNNSFEHIFNSDCELAMYKDAISTRNYKPRIWEQKLHPNGIDMWWSTAVYWRSDSEEARLFFNVWQHVKENYDYYKFLYKFPGKLYRTDYAASIAVHLINGQYKNSWTGQLPGKVMRYSDQIDELCHVHSNSDFLFLCPDPKEPWRVTTSRITDENVHIMNKLSLLRHWDQLMESESDE
jgi:hypothetical protein